MEAKEKAKQLVEKYRKATYQMYTPNNMVIACALIAVEEILKEASCATIHIDRDGLDDNTYWQQVKAEIEKM